MTPQTPQGGRQDDATAPAGPAQAASPDPAAPAAGRGPDDNGPAPAPWMPECPGAGRDWVQGGRWESLACPVCAAGATRLQPGRPGEQPAVLVPRHTPGGLPVRLVNTADWDEPVSVAEVADAGLVIVNSTRPLAGPLKWIGRFRAGTLYAAVAAAEAPWQSWRQDDARLIVFITDAQITAACAAKATGYGYPTLGAAEQDGVTIADWALSLQLPWHGSRP
jgi:hypothetical protein